MIMNFPIETVMFLWIIPFVIAFWLIFATRSKK